MKQHLALLFAGALLLSLLSGCGAPTQAAVTPEPSSAPAQQERTFGAEISKATPQPVQTELTSPPPTQEPPAAVSAEEPPAASAPLEPTPQTEPPAPTAEAVQPPAAQVVPAPATAPAVSLPTPEPQPTPDPVPEPTEALPPPQSLRDTAVAYIGKSAASLIAVIGAPLSTDYAPSCLGDGEDGELIYDGFTVYTYREGNSETVQDVL